MVKRIVTLIFLFLIIQSVNADECTYKTETITENTSASEIANFRVTDPENDFEGAGRFEVLAVATSTGEDLNSDDFEIAIDPNGYYLLKLKETASLDHEALRGSEKFDTSDIDVAATVKIFAPQSEIVADTKTFSFKLVDVISEPQYF